MFKKIILFSQIILTSSFLNTMSFMNNKLFSKNYKNYEDDTYEDDTYEDDTYEDNYISPKIKNIYTSRTPNQKQYNEDIYNDEIKMVVVTGPAGTGKTLFPTQYAAKLLLEKNIKIILTRPMISVDEEFGYLPGGINEKMLPWVVPIYDILGEFMTPQKLEKFINEKRIEVVPLAFMRGRTFKNCLIIGDELQNSSINQMLMLLTRIGENSKIIITGDISQSDHSENGLLDLIKRIKSFYKNSDTMNDDNISWIDMSLEDIQRSKLVSTILSIYN